MRALLCVFIVLLSLDKAAVADTGRPLVTSPKRAVAPKSPAVAVGVSLGVTLAGAGLAFSWAAHRDDSVSVLGGMIMFVGPTLGRWYAGESSLSGLGVRALTAVTTIGIFSALFAERSCDIDTPDCDNTIELAVLFAGGAVWAASSAYDIVRAHHAARDHNARNLTVVPTIQTPAGGATGLALGGRF
jgi:hypothetical protein